MGLGLYWMFWQQHDLCALAGHYACSLLHVDLQSGPGRHVSNDAARLVRILSIQYSMNTVSDRLYSISVNVTNNSETQCSAQMKLLGASCGCVD